MELLHSDQPTLEPLAASWQEELNLSNQSRVFRVGQAEFTGKAASPSRKPDSRMVQCFPTVKEFALLCKSEEK